MKKCPKCDSARLLYCQRVYEYHAFEHASKNRVDILAWDESFTDDDFEPEIQCDDCDWACMLSDLPEAEPEPADAAAGA